MSAQCDPYAVFRPRRGRYVPLAASAAIIVTFVGVAITIAPGTWTTADRVMVVVFGLLIAAVLGRFAMVRAVPTKDELVVHNLLGARHLPWAQIVNVQFGGGSAWALLELDDTETLAVMAVQRADGEFAFAEAGRLAALVDGSTRPPVDH